VTALSAELTPESSNFLSETPTGDPKGPPSTQKVPPCASLCVHLGDHFCIKVTSGAGGHFSHPFWFHFGAILVPLACGVGAVSKCMAFSICSYCLHAYVSSTSNRRYSWTQPRLPCIGAEALAEAQDSCTLLVSPGTLVLFCSTSARYALLGIHGSIVCAC
jgi:hypothetical protein